MTTLEVLRAALIIAVGALALFGGTRLLRWSVGVLPLDTARRTTARRWLPVAQLGFASAVLVIIAVLALGRTPALVVGAAGALLLTAAAWFVIRDVIAGIVLRAEHDLQPGHIIRADDAAGTIHRIGARSIEIEAADGQRVRIPYGRLGSAPLAISRPREDGGALHFTVTLQRRGGGRDDVARIRAAALNAFFASARREPHIRLVAEDAHVRSYDVTIYAADPAFLPAIEEAVTEALNR